MSTVLTIDHSLLAFHIKWWKIKYCSFSFQLLHAQCIKTWIVSPRPSKKQINKQTKVLRKTSAQEIGLFPDWLLSAGQSLHQWMLTAFKMLFNRREWVSLLSRSCMVLSLLEVMFVIDTTCTWVYHHFQHQVECRWIQMDHSLLPVPSSYYVF